MYASPADEIVTLFRMARTEHGRGVAAYFALVTAAVAVVALIFMVVVRYGNALPAPGCKDLGGHFLRRFSAEMTSEVLDGNTVCSRQV